MAAVDQVGARALADALHHARGPGMIQRELDRCNMGRGDRARLDRLWIRWAVGARDLSDEADTEDRALIDAILTRVDAHPLRDTILAVASAGWRWS